MATQPRAAAQNRVVNEQDIPFTMIYNHVVEMLPCIGTDALGVYVVLSFRAGSSTRECFPSLSTLAHDCGLSKQTVIKSIGILAERLLVRVQHNESGGNSEFYSNTYFLLPTAKALEKYRADYPGGYCPPKHTRSCHKKAYASTSVEQRSTSVELGGGSTSVEQRSTSVEQPSTSVEPELYESNNTPINKTNLKDSSCDIPTEVLGVEVVDSAPVVSEKKTRTRRKAGGETSVTADVPKLPQAWEIYAGILGIAKLEGASCVRLAKRLNQVGRDTFTLAVHAFGYDRYAANAGFLVGTFLSRDMEQLASYAKERGHSAEFSRATNAASDWKILKTSVAIDRELGFTRECQRVKMFFYNENEEQPIAYNAATGEICSADILDAVVMNGGKPAPSYDAAV